MSSEERVRLRIRDLSHDGRGIARLHGYTLFIAEALPGEEVLAQITRRKSSFGEARLLSIDGESIERQSPPCPVFFQCGGCQLQHMTRKAQLEFKKKKVCEALERIAKIPSYPPVKIHSPEPWYYRNKGTYHCHQEGRLGFLAAKSHEVIPHQECLIQQREMGRYREELEERRLLSPREGCTLRTSVTGEGILILEREKPSRRLEGLSLKGIYVKKKNRVQHFHGKKRLPEQMGGRTFLVPPTVFFQINPQGREILLQRSWALLNPGEEESLLDIYCGVGALSLPRGEKVKRIMGLDEDRTAIQVAREEAKRWGFHHTTFSQGRAHEVISPLLKEEPTLALLDPPREGCHASLLQQLVKSSLQRIVYISCDPATLARDLKTLKDRYEINGVEIVDMFPQTYHVEVLVSMYSRE